MAGLRLDRKEDAFAARRRGAAIVPGNVQSSLLFQRISDTSDARRMPPPNSHKVLTPDQIATLRRWIEGGAPWQEHWAFKAPVRPKLPVVKAAAWGTSPIDKFILARLEAEGLMAAPTAEKRTLLRRVALDLTGLPPTPAEIETYLADKSPQSYERMVDRYLASPHFGEHRARYWLDVARYGDTHGIHIDNYRQIWPYRDWVIRAFNSNMHFDEFTIEQLAGDLLPNATLDQKIATGFHRCNVTTSEGGAIDDEYYEIYAKDRADTTGAAWLGLTVGCATCHDHKFDPILQKDFYALGAFFRNTPQRAMDGNVSDTPPFLFVPADEDREAHDKLLAKVGSLRADMRGSRDAAFPRFQKWLADGGQMPAEPLGKGVTRERMEKLDASKPFSVSARFTAPDKFTRGIELASHKISKEKNRGWQLDFNNKGILAFRLVGDDGKSVEVRTIDPIEPGKSTHVVATWDGSRRQAGLRLFLNGNEVIAQGRNSESQDLVGSISVEGKPNIHASVSNFRMVNREVTESEIAILGGDGLTWYLVNNDEAFKKLVEAQDKLNESVHEIVARGSITLVMQERTDQTPYANLLFRGAYDQKRQRVEAATPSVLPPMATNQPRNRLGFARWLFAPEHPLTARVAVNRMWQEVFGVGLVKTADDFGSQGEPPSHPELLDWLAVDFAENGWDVKRFYRQLLLSSTYRQSAAVTPAKQAKDPENRLLSRAPRFRLDGEVVRDYVLAASGLLSRQIGGPSVRPYQPEGVWEAVAMNGSNTRFYKRDNGDSLYRRSMYTFWKRSAPPASMDIFNAPSRESCAVRRERTNTPLQALVTMNDEQFFEAARYLAQSVMSGTAEFVARMDAMATRVLSRPLSVAEAPVVRKAFDDYLQHYAKNPADARKLLRIGVRSADPSLPQAELAAYTMVANQLFNLDEALNK
ncbi:MAG: DUF1553 domain-containing protein [Bryobacteraceae bacterium]|nr:DUF1553 domain-containing protein [Bryobacteraceae bacterium]